jgi:hypothetical protein
MIMKSIIGFLNNSNLHAINSTSLKVVCNETSGSSGGWLLFEDGFGPVAINVCLLFDVAVILEVFPFSVCKA